ncbi:MAG: tetratricopeptide repeat protein [Myxococcales bacterium]|nr:tetratricopeptide repeat protein [Myxococcales bacterium]
MRSIAPVVMMMFLVGGVASAQPKPEGTRLFEQGRDLAKAGKYAEACEAFGKSIAIDRAAGTALNYGDCLEHLGQLRKAWQMYDEAAREFDKQADARGKFARERADAVIPKLGTLRVKIAEPTLSGLVVKIGSESLPPQRELVERLEPGTIEVTASAPGHTPFSSSARMVAGASGDRRDPGAGDRRRRTPRSRRPAGATRAPGARGWCDPPQPEPGQALARARDRGRRRPRVRRARSALGEREVQQHDQGR